MRKYRFHLLGLVHLPCSREYMSCAFTQKNYKLAQMLLSLGHEVFYYGAEGSTVPCTRFIQTHTLSDIRREWGDGDSRFEIGYDWKNCDFRFDFNHVPTSTTQKFYDAAVQAINNLKRPDDFLLLTQGLYHKPIADRINLYLKLEPGIGYMGSCPEYFRAFESSFLQSYMYGSETPLACADGKFYDRIIPNYFDPNDFEFCDQPEDYYLYIGRMISRKGIFIAYLACKELGVHLKIAGQGGKIMPDGSLASAGDPTFSIPAGNWEYVGYADLEKRKRLLSRAVATFVPTQYLEPFAGTHVESMLSGTPPITTDFGVFPTTIPDTLNGTIGFRCNTLEDFVRAAVKARTVDRKTAYKYATRFLMDNVRWQFQKWFDDLYQVYLSTFDPDAKGWYYVDSSFLPR